MKPTWIKVESTGGLGGPPAGAMDPGSWGVEVLVVVSVAVSCSVGLGSMIMLVSTQSVFSETWSVVDGVCVVVGGSVVVGFSVLIIGVGVDVGTVVEVGW